MSLSSRIAIAGLAGFLLCALPSTASYAATPQEQLDRARQLIDDAEFEKALQLLNDELEQPGNDQETLAQLYQLQGITYLYLGQEKNARESFEKLLLANPLHELPKSSSPKVRQLFESVREDVRARQAKEARLTHEPPSSAPAGQRLDLQATTTPLPPGAQPQLHFRRAGKVNWSTTRLQPGSGENVWVGMVPAFDLPAEGAPYSLEYYLEVTDAAGVRLAGAGTNGEPLSVHIVAAAAGEPDLVGETPVYKKWWFWAIAGGVVAGAATGAYFLVPKLLDDTATVPVTIKVQQ